MKLETDVAAQPDKGVSLAYLVVLAGICSALHIWKLPPALPAIRAELDMSLVTSGFLLSLVQLAGMTLGLLTGMTAEKIGLRRSVVVGLLLLAASSVGSAAYATLTSLLLWRALEGVGFLLVVLPGPALIRQLVSPAKLSRVLGVWGCYIPVGSIIILLVGSWVLGMANWRVLWLGLAVVTVLVAAIVWRGLPADAAPSGDAKKSSFSAWSIIRLTLSSANIWMVAFMFAMYAGQWISVIGFLPTIYQLSGVSGIMAGVLTAIVAGSNAIGCLYAGRLLHHGFTPRTLVLTGYAAMMISSIVAFAFPVPVWVQFAAVLVFSTLGGLVPTTMFYLTIKLAPAPQATAASVGWMQQLSAAGQFCGPPLIAWVATVVGGWQGTWLVTVAAALLGSATMVHLSRRISKNQPSALSH
ncbi:MFS transporter [Pusillimonas sp. CC-YST705]|uniref:MFS transporter n=1 Tax=Mesopusillimonas faecipullorum TaxID=2755040 RepID=A0ABS8CCS2_9BURK|nr:MFS transporter [Mesopusillimonas faecipullorum]MCB5363649.1 MFS transporter [Mesopusillimonas faecipullorum]